LMVSLWCVVSSMSAVRGQGGVFFELVFGLDLVGR